MVPAGERPALEVVEPEFALEIFVHALGAPALLADAHDLLLAHAPAERREEKLGRFTLALGPFGDEPEWLPFRQLEAVVLGDSDASETEARAELALGSFAPGQPAKSLLTHPLEERRGRVRALVDAVVHVEAHNAQGGMHADREVQPERANRVPEFARVPVGGVGENDLAGNTARGGTLDHVER